MRNILIYIIVLACCVALPLQLNRSTNEILVISEYDSDFLSFSYENDWTDLLQTELSHKLDGVLTTSEADVLLSANTIHSLSHRIRQEKPDIVILEFNSESFGVDRGSLEDYTQSFQAFVNQAVAIGAKVVLFNANFQCATSTPEKKDSHRISEALYSYINQHPQLQREVMLLDINTMQNLRKGRSHNLSRSEFQNLVAQTVWRHLTPILETLSTNAISGEMPLRMF